MRKLAAGLLACAVLTGCGDESTTHGSVESTPSSPKPSGPHEVPNADPATMFTANPAIVSPHSIPFQSWSRVGGRTDAIAVHFTAGSPDCYGVDATATETSESVSIELRTGKLPSSVGKMCTMIAVLGTLEVPLTAPLGNRAVIDGGR